MDQEFRWRLKISLISSIGFVCPLCACMSIFMYVYLFAYLSVYLCVRLCLSLYMFVCQTAFSV